MFELMPFGRNEKNLFNYLDNMEKDFFGSVSSIAHMRTDVLDKGDHYELHAELPGFAKEDIHISVENGCLTIAAQHSEESKEEKGSYIRRERKYGSFQRSFDLTGIDADKITAAYENGILKLALPKQAEVKPESKRIEIG